MSGWEAMTGIPVNMRGSSDWRMEAGSTTPPTVEVQTPAAPQTRSGPSPM